MKISGYGEDLRIRMDWVEETIYIYKTYCFFVLSVFSSVYLSGRGFPGGSLDSLRGVASVLSLRSVPTWRSPLEKRTTTVGRLRDYGRCHKILGFVHCFLANENIRGT